MIAFVNCCRLLKRENSYEIPSVASLFPYEVLREIFLRLPGRQLLQCRRVCIRWKKIIDDLDNDHLWREKCQEEYGAVFKMARLKSELSWRSLYKSLYLWSKITSASEHWKSIDCCIDGRDIHTIHAWKGTAAAHKIDSIVYYDIKTLNPIRKIELGEYMLFEENDDVMVYLLYETSLIFNCSPNSLLRHLRVVPKVNGQPVFKDALDIDNVNNFVIFNGNLYYNQFSRTVHFKSGLYMCEFNKNNRCQYIESPDKSVWAFSSKGNILHCLHSNNKISSLIANRFIYTDDIDDESTRFYKLFKYNIAERVNFPDQLSDNGVESLHRLMLDYIVRVYGDILLTGSKNGVLRIYHGPSFYMDRNTPPIKKYNLRIRFRLAYPEISGIDVIEKEGKHVVIVCTWNKLMVLSLKH